MGVNKRQNIFLSVIGVATLLVAIVGATFAYFTINMSGTSANVSASTAKIGAISFTANGVSATKILPGWTSGAKTVSVTLAPTDYSVKYTCELNVTSNAITDLTLAVSGTNALTAANGAVQTGATTIASGTIPASSTAQTKTMTYTLSFPETGADQNTQQNKSIAATVSCKTDGNTIYYNNANQSGTTTKPTN